MKKRKVKAGYADEQRNKSKEVDKQLRIYTWDVFVHMSYNCLVYTSSLII